MYVLVGGSDESSLPVIYVGEGDPVKDRLNWHHSKKEFWDYNGVLFSYQAITV